MAELITSLTLIFLASAVTLLVAKKLSQPAIPAYITAGIIVGLFVEGTELLGLAEMGIAFLVFIFGLKFDPEKLTSVRNEALAVNSIQVILIGALSFSFAYILGLNPLQSFYFSIAATLSSSLVGLELISEEVDKNLIHGRLAESINLIQDVLAVAAVVALSSPAFILSEISFKFVVTAAMIAGALFTRRFIFDRIASLAEGSTELLMLTSLSFLTGFTALSQYYGLSMVVGAFAAGIAVAKFPHNLEILDTMGSIKDFFSAIFFVTLGALISIPGPGVIFLTASLVFLVSIVKPGMIISSLIHQGYDPRTSFMTGVSLDQISEFALIIAIQASIAGNISEPLFQAIILSATITMTTSSYTKLYEDRLFEFLKSYNMIESGDQVMPESSVEEELEDHIILVGYDTQGKELVEKLKELDQQFVVMENDPEKVSDLRKKEENYIYGNILNDETWKYAEPEKAKLVISTAPFRDVSEKLLNLDTDTDVILRSGNLMEAEELIERGALYVIVPEVLTAEQVKEHLLGIQANENYREELRRRNLLEVRSYLQDEEG